MSGMDQTARDFTEALNAVSKCDMCGAHTMRLTTFSDPENELTVCDGCRDYVPWSEP